VNTKSYQAGDILVASDNVARIPRGYMGHSSLMISQKELIEATDSVPYIRVLPIEKFQHDHPIHAQYRPKSAEMGHRAAYCALDYLQKYVQSMRQGTHRPPFSFTTDIPLHDPWSSVYCSKLVWLCYYYGANYAFPNDFFLFTPQDLDAHLQQDPHFTLIYKHPQHLFRLDT